MPPRSVIEQLPVEIREWLDAELVRRGFGGYLEITAALNEKLAGVGLEMTVGKTAVNNYGKNFEERIQALKRSTEVARTLAHEIGDDEGVLSDALMRLVQDKLFNVLLDIEVDPSKINVLKLGHVISDLVRASVAQKKHMAEIRAKAAAVADSVATKARKGGLSDDAVQALRREILGIADAHA